MNIEPVFSTFYDLNIMSKVLMDYIPSPLSEHFNKTIFNLENSNGPSITINETLQIFLDNSNNQLKQYGKAEDLLENLNVYMNFPLNYKRFGAPQMESMRLATYEKGPFNFKSLKGNLFVRKQDFLRHLRSRTFMLNMSQPIAEVMKLIKKHEDRFDNCCEYIQYDQKMADEIYERLQEVVDDPHNKNNLTFISHAQLNPDIQNLLNPLMEMMNNGIQPTPAKSDSEESKNHVDVMNGIINLYPSLFYRYSEINSPDAPIVVRIFENDDQKFVMKAELFKDGRINDSEEKVRKLEDKNGILWAMDYNEVVEKFKDQIDKIEFISVPIQRAKHAAVPIVTPSGDHCILASDVVSELLRRMISALKVFQNFNRNRWQMVSQYMDYLNSKIYLKANDKFFITTALYDRLKQETDSYWSKIIQGAKINNKYKKGLSPKLVRDVGELGFSLKHFEEELKNLGLTAAFPDIMRVAKSVYSRIFKERKEPLLGTCDLIDGIEKCQMYSVLNKFPLLREFLKKQALSSDSFDLFEDTSHDNPAKLMKNTGEWVNVDDLQTVLRSPSHGRYRTEIDVTLDCPNQKTIASNYKFLTDDQIEKGHVKYFLFEMNDLRWIDKNEMEECLMNYELFMKKLPKKQFYIRKFACGGVDQVFAEDVINILKILLKRNNKKPSPSYNILESYRQKWKTDNKILYRMITLNEFRSILNECGIDKSQVTVVPDIVRSKSQALWINGPVEICMRTTTPDGQPAFDSSQAIFRVFNSVVCGINWKLDCCKKHPHCKLELKKEVIRVIREYYQTGLGDLILCDAVEKVIHKLREHCTYQQQKEVNLSYFDTTFPHLGVRDLLPPSSYNSVFESYGLVNRFKDLFKPGEAISIPVWMYRVSYMFEWTKTIFDDSENLDLLHVIASIILTRVPEDNFRRGKIFLEKLLDCQILTFSTESVEIEEKQVEGEENRPETLDNRKKSPKTETIQKSSEPVVAEKSPEFQKLPEDLPAHETLEKPRKTAQDGQNAAEKRSENTGKRRRTASGKMTVEAEHEKADGNDENKMKDEFGDSDDKNDSLEFGGKNEVGASPQYKEDQHFKQSTECLECLKKSETINCLEKTLRRTEENDESFANATDEIAKINEEIRIQMNKMVNLREENTTIVEQARLELEKATGNREKAEKRVKEKEDLLKKEKLKNESLEKKIGAKDIEIDKLKLKHLNLLKSKEKEIEMLKRNASKSIEERNEWKLKVKEVERKWEECHKLNVSLMENNQKLEQNILNIQQKSNADHTDHTLRINLLELEVFEKNRIIEEMKEENSKLISDQKQSKEELDDTFAQLFDHNEEQRRIIQKLLGRSVISTATSTSECSFSNEEQIQCELQLASLKKIKDSMDNNKPVELAKEMVENLISVTNRPEILQFANYEFQQYEGKIRNYRQTVGLNFLNLKKSSDISSICPLPEFPSFSDKFMTEYWSEMDKKSSIELSDSECYICFSEMKSDEKILECEHCKKITHLECASKWLQIHRSCGHCRQKQLDPNEFPALR